MSGKATIDGLSFESAIAHQTESPVSARRALGYKCQGTTLRPLRRLDLVCSSVGHPTDVVTRDLADAWEQAAPNEGGRQRRARMCPPRQLSPHQRSMGVEAYVPREAVSVETSAPYIPTPAETASFLRVVDSCEDPRLPHVPGGHRVAFRLMRPCGLRISECASLAISDVDVAGGKLLIRQSKGNKDRIVYVSDALAEMPGRHVRTLRGTLGPRARWLFPGAGPSRHIGAKAYDKRFASFWAKVPGSSDAPRRPTPHSLGYRLVVDRINSWAGQGVDLRQMLPHLARYLGHETSAETFYCYGQVEEAMPIVRELGLAASAAVMPEAVVSRG